MALLSDLLAMRTELDRSDFLDILSGPDCSNSSGSANHAQEYVAIDGHKTKRSEDGKRCQGVKIFKVGISLGRELHHASWLYRCALIRIDRQRRCSCCRLVAVTEYEDVLIRGKGYCPMRMIPQ